VQDEEIPAFLLRSTGLASSKAATVIPAWRMPHAVGCGPFFRPGASACLTPIPRRRHCMALVGVIMGSDSDLPTMSAACEMLKKFDIPFEVDIVSAHRTPGTHWWHCRCSVDCRCTRLQWWPARLDCATTALQIKWSSTHAARTRGVCKRSLPGLAGQHIYPGWLRP
jgi:hypothetical protein